MANPSTKTSRSASLYWTFPKLSTLSSLRNFSMSWNSIASRDLCTGGLRTSSHSARCEWLLMASSPVRHPWPLGYPRPAVSVPYQRSSRCCPIISVSQRGWLSSLQGDSLSPRPHHPAARPTAVGDMGRIVWDEVQSQGKCYIMSLRNKSTHLYSLENHNWSKSHQSPTLEFISLRICPGLNTSAPSPKKKKKIRKRRTPASASREETRSCTEECRRTAYLALVRSVLEYSVVVWDPHQQRDIDTLEDVQHRAAHFNNNNNILY